MIICKYKINISNIFSKLKYYKKENVIKVFNRDFHISYDLMAGHSHWANIARHKAKMDLIKSKQFTKISQEIKMSVKLAKNGDPKENPRLATALQKAKAVNFPKDKIEDLINRGLGKMSSDLFDISYELYGPNRVAMVVQVITDNKNRSIQALKHWANKNGGGMATAGAFDFLFQRAGVVQFKSDLPEDKIMEIVISTGADDVDFSDDGIVHVACPPDEDTVWKIKEKLEENGIEVIEACVTKIPQTKVRLDEEQKANFEESLNVLYEVEPDIQDIYHNAEFED